MSLQPVLRYSLDLSGNNTDNLVIGEVHSLGPVAPNRSIAPQYGAFYTAGLKVRDVGGTIDAIAWSNIALTGAAPLIIGSISLGDNPAVTKRVRLANQTNPSENGFYTYSVSGSVYTLTPMALGNLLVAGQHYVPTMLHQDATRVSGKEVCQLIVITDQTILGDVVLEYQTVGGEYSVSSDALEQLIETLNLDNRPVVWGEIIGLPNAFPPVDHLHHIQDFKGFGHVVDALDDIRSMLSGELNITPGGSGGGLTIHVGPNPPTLPEPKQLWWNNDLLRMFLYYEDPNGVTPNNVWVEVTGSAGTGLNMVELTHQEFATQNALYTFPHDLTTAPTAVFVSLKCIDAEFDYVEGDYVPLANTNDSATNVHVYYDGTNVYVQLPAADDLSIRNKANTLDVNPTLTQWEIIVSVSVNSTANVNDVVNVVSAAGVLTLNLLSTNRFTVLLTEDITDIQVINAGGPAREATILFSQDATTAYTISGGYPVSFHYEGATPEVNATLDSLSELTIRTYDSGTNWLIEMKNDFN